MRKLLQNLSANFESLAEVEAITSVDEQIIPFKGKLSLKKYNKNKPAKWGIKIYALAGKSGFIHRFFICGDTKTAVGNMEDTDGIGVSGETVLALLLHPQPPPPGVQVFFDNYFSSPALLAKLKEADIPATCTVRSNRVDRCPLKPERELKKEGRGAMDYRISSDGILVAKWYDNKEVFISSNHYSVQPAVKVRRWEKSKNKYIFILCPSLIAAYNIGMGGVDRCDQLLSFYR